MKNIFNILTFIQKNDQGSFISKAYRYHKLKTMASATSATSATSAGAKFKLGTFALGMAIGISLNSLLGINATLRSSMDALNDGKPVPCVVVANNNQERNTSTTTATKKVDDPVEEPFRNAWSEMEKQLQTLEKTNVALRVDVDGLNSALNECQETKVTVDVDGLNSALKECQETKVTVDVDGLTSALKECQETKVTEVETLAEPLSSVEASAAICTIQKGGLYYVDEFVDYHLALGFKTIYLYDNSDDLELQEWSLRRNPAQVVVQHFPGMAQQLPAYSHCARRIKEDDSHAWIAFIDIDEFIVLKGDEPGHIMDLLNTVDSEAGGLSLNWVFFGSSHQRSYTPAPLTKRFQMRESDVNMHVKTIARTSMWSKTARHSHNQQYEGDATSVDTRGHRVGLGSVGPRNHDAFNPEGPSDIAVIHHYHTKSLEEYRARCKRGLADQHPEAWKNQKACIKNETELLEHVAPGSVFDDSAWQVLKRNMPFHYMPCMTSMQARMNKLKYLPFPVRKRYLASIESLASDSISIYVESTSLPYMKLLLFSIPIADYP
jgi:hypothetical protein